VQSPVNLFTHLSSADDPELSTTADQLARFRAATASLQGERSIANSAGMLTYADAQADWVGRDCCSTARRPSRVRWVPTTA